MLLTPHALTGMVIAKYEPHLLPAALAAVTLHFILDAIPHTDMIGAAHVNKGNILLRLADTLLLLCLFFWLVPAPHHYYFAMVVIFAILPDLIEIPALIWPVWRRYPLIRQFSYWHTHMLQYSKPKVNWAVGLLPQIILCAVCIYYLVN